MEDSIDDLIRVLEIQNQEDIAEVMDIHSLRKSNIFSYKVMRPELDDSCTRLIEFLRDNIDLSFGGVYINSDLDTGAQIDLSSRNVVPAHWDDVNPNYVTYQSPYLNGDDSGSRIVHKLRSGDADPFGIIVLEKDSFSVQDVALIKDAVRKFSAHIENISEKYSLREQVITDDLTDLFNRRKFKRDYRTATNNWNQGVHFGLGFGDLDHFKDVNTFYGHEYGDLVLETVAKIMRRVVGSRGTVYRWGGEEFTMICPGASPERMERIARDISNGIREYVFPDGANGRKAREITMSFGTVSTQEEKLEDRRLMGVAIRRLAKAKGYDNRDRIISNVRFDIDTGIASMPLFIPHLKDRIAQCNVKKSRDEYGLLAVMNFDIVHFSHWIQDLGSDAAFDVLKNLVEWWKGQTSSFGYVARDNNRDGILTSMYSAEEDPGFMACVVEKAYEYLDKLRDIPLYSGLHKVDFDFAVGGVIYDPRKIDFIPKPRFLTHAAEVLVNKAADLPERVMVDCYDGNVPEQLMSAYAESECVCNELESNLP